jgi:hypothetical protein
MNFKDNFDGTITDNVTGLVWMKCSAGQLWSKEWMYCNEGSSIAKNWQEAVDYCNNISDYLPGTGWRLPSRFELQTLLNYGADLQMIYSDFPNTQDNWYWSYSSYAYTSMMDYRWAVSFHYGTVEPFYKDGLKYVRCVRSGNMTNHNFTDNGNGTVTDSGTGIMWQKAIGDGCDQGKCNWKDALKYCENLQLADYSDWRLPDIKELSNLSDDTKYNPAIDNIFKSSTQNNYYWSSSPSTASKGSAWIVDFSNGRVFFNNKINTNYVRCMRSEK